MFIFVFFIVLLWQNGKTPLHIACEKGRKDTVSLLLDNNPNLEVMDSVSNFILNDHLLSCY